MNNDEANMHTHSVRADGLGSRDNAGKTERFDLVPAEFEAALAIHYGNGAMKYPDPPRNWERGMAWSKCYASARRHMRKWWSGTSFDEPDPKMPGYQAHHLVAAIWNLVALYTYETRNIGEDDRVIMERGQYVAPFVPNPLSVAEAFVLSAEARRAIVKSVNFWYLVTPYTRFPAGHEAAALLACRLAAKLLRAGVPTFSPIAHSHPIAVAGLQDVQVDHDFWVKADAPLLAAAGGIIVVMAESWEESRGMRHEIEQYEAAGKPVLYWDPAAEIPAELLA